MFRAKPLQFVTLLSLVGCGFGCGDDHSAQPPDEHSVVDAGDESRADAARPEAGEPIPSSSQLLMDAATSGNFALDSAAPDAANDAGRATSEDLSTAPRFTSFETALAIQPSGPMALISITKAGQEAHFSFEATAGGFYVFSTESSNFSPDNSIELYDESHTLLAANDEGTLWPGDGIDARLVVHTPSAGHYFIKVYDKYTSAAFFTNSSFPLLYYHLTFKALTENSPGFAVVSAGKVGEAEFAKDDRNGYGYLTVVGELHPDATETIAFKGAADLALIGHLLPGGVKGTGSSTDPNFLRVVTADQHTLAQIERGKEQEYIHPPIGAGSYELKLQAKADVGANGFYAIDLVTLPENPREHADKANDKLEGAEPIEFIDASKRRGLLLTSLPAADFDYFRFDATDGLQHVLIACEGESGGSGVRKLRAELRDATDHILVFGIEPATANLLIDNFMLPSTGAYYLRLSSETPLDVSQPEPWARCVVRLGP